MANENLILKDGLQWILPHGNYVFVQVRSPMVSHIMRTGQNKLYPIRAACQAEVSREPMYANAGQTYFKLCPKCREAMERDGFVFYDPNEPEQLKKARERAQKS